MTYYRSHLVAAKQTKDIRIPFNGLYNSYLGDELDIELEQCTHEMADSDATAVYDLIYSLDLKKYHQALAEGYGLFVIDSLNNDNGLSLEVSDIDYAPMNMQNRGDELLACVNVNTLPIIPLADLQPYANDSLTSHSGFSSFYDPNLQHLEGARLENWNDVYITFIIEYLVNEYLASDISDIEYSFIDELRCNGGAIELLMNNITAEQCEQLNALLYKDK